MIDYSLTFLTGLLTSMHCLGMCGVIILAYSAQPSSGNQTQSKLADLFLHVSYNGGRILSYALLGALVGIIGLTIGWFKGAIDYFSQFSGVVMIVSGFALLGWIPVSPRFSFTGSNSILTKIQGTLLRKKTLGSKLSLGFLTPLLPCGMLYAMLVKAAATGSALNGALTMGVFAAGMTPALIALGSVSSIVSARFRKGAEQLGAIMIILMGIILLMRGFHVPFLGWLSSEPACPHCAS